MHNHIATRSSRDVLSEVCGHSYDLSALIDHMNLYVLGLIVADLEKPEGAHRHYDEDEIMGLAHFLHDTLPVSMSRPAVPQRAAPLVRPA